MSFARTFCAIPSRDSTWPDCRQIGEQGVCCTTAARAGVDRLSAHGVRVHNLLAATALVGSAANVDEPAAEMAQQRGAARRQRIAAGWRGGCERTWRDAVAATFEFELPPASAP